MVRVRSAMAKLNPGKFTEYLPVVFVALASIYAVVNNRIDVLVLSAGVGFACFGLKLPFFNTLTIVAMAIFLGAYLPFGNSNDMIVKRVAVRENFANEEFEDEQFEDEQFEDEIKEKFQDEQFEDEQFEDEQFEDEQFEDEKFEDEKFDGEVKENFDNEQFEDEQFEDEKKEQFDDMEGFANEKSEKPKRKKSKKALPPNNGDRAEPLVLGKKYKIPSEDDDEEYHLDAGTTFLNAYKSLNPDQISAMTKDTQDLINTQKQLMSTLTSLKPLITDGKAMMQQFSGLMGGEGAGLGDLSKMAEQFAGKK